MTVGIGLYGDNGHQLHRFLLGHRRAHLAATAAFAPESLPAAWHGSPSVRRYATLAQLLADPRVAVVSLCSPRRADQAEDAIACLRAGRAVYAEKPAALEERDLDRILATAAATGSLFREMSDTAFDPHFAAARRAIRSGVLGRIVQVHAQKSYPFHDGRPLDDGVDGGLIRWVGVHAVRMIEHVVGEHVREVTDARTGSARLAGRSATVAASLAMTLESGGLATAVVNYLNPPGSGVWGDDRLVVFGTEGRLDVSAADGTRLVLGDQDLGPLPLPPAATHFDGFLDELLGGPPLPMPPAEELHATRVVIRAHAKSA